MHPIYINNRFVRNLSLIKKIKKIKKNEIFKFLKYYYGSINLKFLTYLTFSNTQMKHISNQ